MSEDLGFSHPGLSFTTKFRQWRRTLKGKLPYVRRRVHKQVVARYDALTAALGNGIPFASEAALTEVRPVTPGAADDLCLFLSYQPGATLKPHVVAHVTALLDRGVRVVLILNAVLPADQIRVDPALATRLDGLYVRENIGYDFAGWAHVFGVVSRHLAIRRLFLVNDSIIGPLDEAAFDRVIARFRGSRADVVGLTEALSPRPHLQSFFLVFNQRAIAEALPRFFAHVLSFADKGTVIDAYETRLTQRLRDEGFTCEALFPPMIRHALASNDTYYLWNELIDAGFPFLKVSVMNENPDHPTVKRLVTSRFQSS